jgi:hypothetical protein
LSAFQLVSRRVGLAKRPREDPSSLKGNSSESGKRAYERLDGVVPILHAPSMAERAEELRDVLATGTEAFAEILAAEPPRLQALLVADEDWRGAPRESERSYPAGLPYFTRVTDPPSLVLPETLSPVITPHTGATLPLTVWHELAHALLLRRDVVRTPAWLRELIPQALSAAVARRAGLSLGEHFSKMDREPGFTVRGLKGHADPGEQMAFQNLLLLLGDAALNEFGEAFLMRLVRDLWGETDVVDEERAEELLARALGERGREWLRSRPEF